MEKNLLKVQDYNDPLDHLREFDDPERKQRVEDICDDLICHCHGCWPKVVGLMAVEIDTLRQNNKELKEWLANMTDFFDVDKVFAHHGNVERSHNLKQKYGSYEAIHDKAWELCNNKG